MAVMFCVYVIVRSVVKTTRYDESVIIRPPETMRYKSLKPLRIVGTAVVNSDRVVTRLVGVTTDEFRFHPQKNGIETLKKNLLEVKNWGVNMVVLYLQQPYKVDKRMNEIVELANWSTENGLYTLVFPVVHGDDDIPPESQKLPREKTVYTPLGENTKEILDKLSYALKDNVGVLYGLGAEHHNIPQDVLYNREMELIDTVRKNSPNSVVVINGMEYGHYLEMYLGKPPKQPNILYDIHQYVASDEANIDKSKCKIPEQYLGKLPIILGEFGGAYTSGFGSPKDLECVNSFIFSAQSKGVGYVVHTIDNMSRMGLFDWRNQITSKGKLLKRSLDVNNEKGQ